MHFSRTYRSLLRLRDIAAVLTRHGLGHIVERLELGRHVPFLGRLSWLPARNARPESEEHLAERLVRVLEDLGPTFIKLGQLLSSRPDILPDAWLPAFRRLQDDVPPFATEVARARVEEALGRTLEEAYARFDESPVASGSIGQVHLAALRDGREVVVKIRRPGIERQVQVDLELLTSLAQLAEYSLEELRGAQPALVVAEFARSVKKELDFVSEARQTEIFQTLLASDEGVCAPRVHWDLTTSSVLTIERLPGENIGDVERLERLGIDRPALARTLARSFVRQIFEAGTFHADPHPGNILVDERGGVGLIDFGMVGKLSPKLKGQLGAALLAMARGDLELMVQIATDVGAFYETRDLDAARSDLQELVERYVGVPLTRVRAADIFADLARTARKHQIVLPRDFVLLGKCLVTISTQCGQLDPNFSLASAVRPHLWGIVASKLDPLTLYNSAALQLWNLGTLLTQLPDDLKQVSRRLRRGELAFVQRHEGLEPLSRAIERAASRLAIALLLGALLVGSALLAQQLELPTLALGGFIAALLAGLWLAIDIVRTRR